MDETRRGPEFSMLLFAIVMTVTPGCTVFTDVDAIAADDVPCPVQPDGLTACGDPLYTACVLPGEGGQTCVEVDHCDPPPEGLCPDYEFWQCVSETDAMPSCQDVDECEDSPCPDDQVCVNRLGAPPDCRDAIWVSANRGDDETQGTRSSPLATVQEALTRVEGINVVIALEPGTYEGAIRVDGLEDLAIVGIGEGDVVISCPAEEDRNVVVANSSRITLSNLHLEGGNATGLLVRNVTDLVVRDVEFTKVGLEAEAGVVVVDVSDVVGLVLHRIEIRDYGVSPGSFQGVWIRDSGDVVIENTTILGPQDAASATNNAGGITVQQVTGLNINRVSISDLRGGDGSDATSDRGGWGLGLEVRRGGDAILRDVTIVNVGGGHGRPGGNGGEAVGLRVIGDASVSRASVKEILGGDGGDDTSNGGAAQGIVIEGRHVSLTNAAVWHVLPGQGGANRPDANCVLAQDLTESAEIDHLSCLDIAGRGVRVLRSVGSVTHSILSKINGDCVEATGEIEGADLASITVDSSVLFSCTAGPDITIGVDPLFRDEDNGDLHLRPGSPCIDAGSSDSKRFGREPAPNGCLTNLGAYGGTPEATSKPGANHCP